MRDHTEVETATAPIVFGSRVPEAESERVDGERTAGERTAGDDAGRPFPMAVDREVGR